MLGIFHKMGKSLSKAGEMITGIGPTPVKQFKNAIIGQDEDKAIQLYTTGEGEKSLQVELHPSSPFPSKKANNVSDTPLHLATKHGMTKLVMLLLKNGGDPSGENQRKETCLHSVCSMPDDPDARSALIDELINWQGITTDSFGVSQAMEKVSVNHIDIDGNAAIHYAGSNGLVTCVEKLVLLGAIISIVNRANITCCEMADEKGHKSLALMLELALVFQPVDESMVAFDAMSHFAFDGVPGKLLVNTCSLTMGGVNDFLEAAIRAVGEIVGGDLLAHRSRTEALLELVGWDVQELIKQYMEHPDKLLISAKMTPAKSSNSSAAAGDVADSSNSKTSGSASRSKSSSRSKHSSDKKGSSSPDKPDKPKKPRKTKTQGDSSSSSSSSSAVPVSDSPAEAAAASETSNKGLVEQLVHELVDQAVPKDEEGEVKKNEAGVSSVTSGSSIFKAFTDKYAVTSGAAATTAASVGGETKEKEEGSDSVKAEEEDNKPPPDVIIGSVDVSAVPSPSSSTPLSAEEVVLSVKEGEDTLPSTATAAEEEGEVEDDLESPSPSPVPTEVLEPSPATESTNAAPTISEPPQPVIAAHLDVTTITEACTICGDEMLQSVDVAYFIKGTVLEPTRRQLTCLSQHSFCVSCWSAHLQVQVVEKGLGWLPCPGFKCGERLDIEWASIVFSNQETINRLIQQRQRHVVDVSGLRPCPVESCGLIVCLPCKPQTHYTATTASTLTSPARKTVYEHQIPMSAICENGHAFCLSCTQVAHSPLGCSDYPSWFEQVREETKKTDIKDGTSGEEVANAMWVAANTKRCPRCSTPIEKDEGCNHMCCRKCRKEFCWICMQDWSLHSDNTGGYFQCNRFRETKEGETPDMFADEKGSAHAETLRLRAKGARMARFIHYFTRHQAHGDSVKMEARMFKDTLARIGEGLRASRDGNLRWLQRGNGIVNPLEVPAAEVAAVNPHEKAAPNTSSSSSSSSSSSALTTPVKAMTESSQNKAAAKNNVSFATHAVKSEECLAFLHDGFVELLKCREILRWSYPYAYFEFEDRSANEYGYSGSHMSRHARGRQHEHRTSFEILQADLESMVETLSDVVARRRLRAGRNQISLATRVARSKRIELEQCLIVYSVLKQENAAREGSKNTTPSTLRHRSTPGSSRTANNTSSSSNTNRAPQRVMGELQDHEVVNLVRLLRELDGLSPDTSSHRDGTHSGGGSPVRDGPATLQELVTAGAPLPPTAPRRINMDGTERTPPPTPPRIPSSIESRRSAGGTRVHRHRHRTTSGEGAANANTVRDSLNSPTRVHRPRSASNPPNPFAAADGPTSAEYLAELNADSNADNEDDALSVSSSSEGEDDDATSAAMTEAIISSLNTETRRMGASTAAVEQGERVARSVASDIRMARLTRRAEEEAALNRAILMSIQDSVLSASGDGAGGAGGAAAGGGDAVAPPSEADVETMMAMGFAREEVVQALRETRNNVELAANRLLMGSDF